MGNEMTAELPKPRAHAFSMQYSGPIFSEDQMNAHYLAGVEAGRASRAQSEWQPIETAPKDGTHVLTWWARAARVGWIQGAGQSRDGGDWWNTHERVAMAAGEARPTHWMPLPSEPATLGETK